MLFRTFDAPRGGTFLGLTVLLAIRSAWLGKSLNGEPDSVGALNLGGGIDPVHNALGHARRAGQRRASTLLVPISARRDLNDLSDELATKISVLLYTGTRGAAQGSVRLSAMQG